MLCSLQSLCVIVCMSLCAYVMAYYSMLFYVVCVYFLCFVCFSEEVHVEAAAPEPEEAFGCGQMGKLYIYIYTIT